MHYLLTPNHEVLWCHVAGVDIEQLAAAGHDIGVIDWARAEEQPFSSALLGLALRYGTACSRGIVLSARHTSKVGKAAKMRALQAEHAQSSAEIDAANGELMEALMPGWREAGQRSDAAVAESAERFAVEADAALEKQLAVDVRPELVEHWGALGGAVY